MRRLGCSVEISIYDTDGMDLAFKPSLLFMAYEVAWVGTTYALVTDPQHATLEKY